MALVDNEHLRMEVGALRQATASLTGVQAGYQEADGEYTHGRTHTHTHTHTY